MTTPRIAFIGCGTHSTNNLYPCLAYADCTLDAVVDLDRALAERNARIFGGASSFTDVRKMLDERKPDGVFIVGPPQIHYEIGKVVLGRGIPLYVEKPTAPSLAQAREMVALARANGTFVMTGYMKRFGLPYRKARELIATGGFDPSMGWFRYAHWPTSDLGNMLLVMSVHIIDLAISFFGAPLAVSSQSMKRNDRVSIALTLRFAGGRMAQLTLDSSQPRIQERIEISGVLDGANALIVVDNVQHMELHRGNDGGVDVHAPSMAEIEPRVPLGEISIWRPDYGIPNMGQTRHFFQGFTGAVREFVNAIKAKRDPSPSPEEALWAMEVIDAVMRKPDGTTELRAAAAAG